ncbi:N utilization substance protein A, partial [Candidatus Arthromitus sp. SFB-4]
DSQLSLAIGKEGQNVRLAARLTGWKIDIKPLSKVESFYDENNENEEVFKIEENIKNDATKFDDGIFQEEIANEE